MYEVHVLYCLLYRSSLQYSQRDDVQDKEHSLSVLDHTHRRDNLSIPNTLLRLWFGVLKYVKELGDYRLAL
jgi:hypothetical protein